MNELPCTIIIPTKDRPKMLQRAILSALNALPPDGEVIIVDDRSTTPANDVARTFQDQRIKVLINDRAPGGSSARNCGMLAARGKVLFFLDDDDEILPHYCDYVLKVALAKGNQADFGCSAIEISTARTKPSDPPILKRRSLPDGIVGPAATFKEKTFPFSIGLWMTKRTYLESGLICESMPTNSDTEYSCRLFSQEKRFWYSRTPGVRIHIHGGEGGQLARVTNRIPARERALVFERIMNRHKEFIAKDNSARRFLLRRFLELSIKGGQIQRAWSALSAQTLGDRLRFTPYVAARTLLQRSQRRE